LQNAEFEIRMTFCAGEDLLVVLCNWSKRHDILWRKVLSDWPLEAIDFIAETLALRRVIFTTKKAT